MFVIDDLIDEGPRFAYMSFAPVRYQSDMRWA